MSDKRRQEKGACSKAGPQTGAVFNNLHISASSPGKAGEKLYIQSNNLLITRCRLANLDDVQLVYVLQVVEPRHLLAALHKARQEACQLQVCAQGCYR